MNKRSIPTWLMALSVVILLGQLTVFGVFTIVHPELPFPGLSDDAAHPIRFMAARHLAMAAVLMHALLARDIDLLRAMFTMFFTLAVVDLGLTVAYDTWVPLAVRVVGDLGRLGNAAVVLVGFVLPMGGTMVWLRRNT